MLNNKKQLQLCIYKKALGSFIKEERLQKGMSQRELARLCTSGMSASLPNSNLKYIEDGINAPSPKVYELIVKYLELSAEKHELFDELYSKIRKIPPPDICEIILANQGINKVLRLISDKELTSADYIKIQQCFESIVNNKGNNNHETI